MEHPTSCVPLPGISVLNCLLKLLFHHAIAQLLKEDVDSWNTFPPACLHVWVLAVHEEGTKTAPFISYDVPVRGTREKQSFLIFRELQSTGLLLHACIYSAVLCKFHTCKQFQHLQLPLFSQTLHLPPKHKVICQKLYLRILF